MIYIVTWFLLTWHVVPCPDAAKPDTFGRGELVTRSCGVLHASVDTIQYSKTFTDRDSAFAFYHSGEKECRGLVFMSDEINSIRIDSTHADQPKEDKR